MKNSNIFNLPFSSNSKALAEERQNNEEAEETAPPADISADDGFSYTTTQEDDQPQQDQQQDDHVNTAEVSSFLLPRNVPVTWKIDDFPLLKM